MTNTQGTEKNRLPTGQCPFCDAERGITTAWGMSPEGWGNLKDAHDAGHLQFNKMSDGTIEVTPPLKYVSSVGTSTHDQEKKKCKLCLNKSDYLMSSGYCRDCVKVLDEQSKESTHDQIQWKKEFDELPTFTKHIGTGTGTRDEKYVLVDKTFFIQTLQHLHDEVMENNYWHFGDEVVSTDHLQAIFARYGVGDNK